MGRRERWACAMTAKAHTDGRNISDRSEPALASPDVRASDSPMGGAGRRASTGGAGWGHAFQRCDIHNNSRDGAQRRLGGFARGNLRRSSQPGSRRHASGLRAERRRRKRLQIVSAGVGSEDDAGQLPVRPFIICRKVSRSIPQLADVLEKSHVKFSGQVHNKSNAVER